MITPPAPPLPAWAMDPDPRPAWRLHCLGPDGRRHTQILPTLSDLLLAAAGAARSVASDLALEAPHRTGLQQVVDALAAAPAFAGTVSCHPSLPVAFLLRSL